MFDTLNSLGRIYFGSSWKRRGTVERAEGILRQNSVLDAPQVPNTTVTAKTWGVRWAIVVASEEPS